MTVYKPIKQSDGTFQLSLEDMATLREKYSSEAIFSALLKLYELDSYQVTAQESVAVDGDLPPCPGCGGTSFLRTGTCHVCQTCGTSQGCS